MTVITIGPELLKADNNGRLRSNVATIFMADEVIIITEGPTHFKQRMTYQELINKKRVEQGLPELLGIDNMLEMCECAVDLIVTGTNILIRPEPDKMTLALRADECLQEIAPKSNIRFMYANDPLVQQAIRETGEYWRICPYPKRRIEIIETIDKSRIAISGDLIYYYSAPTGTRYLTYHEFKNLSKMDDEALRSHLIEISNYSAKTNKLGHREVAFFATGASFNHKSFEGFDFKSADVQILRTWHSKLSDQFKAAVPPELHRDSTDNRIWSNKIISALINEDKNVTIAGNIVNALTPEFFRMIRWLPGGRFNGRELIFDSVFSQNQNLTSAEELDNLLDRRVKGFIGNFICEFGQIEHINIGRIMPSIRKRGERNNGHRIYLAEIKLPGENIPVLRILRVLQWGIRERLDLGKDLLIAYNESMEYVDFIKQRRLACGELGMPLPGRIDFKHITEVYNGKQTKYQGEYIWTFYFEREFINGLATDKIPDSFLQEHNFCQSFAKLLGQAAAPNMVVGRMDKKNNCVIFDGGDEMLLSDSKGHPQRLVVADHAGTFYEYTSPLVTFAKAYAKPVIDRLQKVADPDKFTQIYLDAIKQRLLALQEECKMQQNAFKVRFQHSKQGAGTFPDRWDKALKRLQATDVASLVERIRKEIEEAPCNTA